METLRYSTDRRQRGVVLLALIALIFIGFTGALISKTSINDVKTTRQNAVSQRIAQALDTLLAFSLTQTPLGRLPCPDSTGNGEEDVTVGGCLSLLGWLPYKTLGLAIADEQSKRLWYSPDGAFVAPVTSHNSSRQPILNLDSTPTVAVVIYPGDVLDAQGRNGNDPTDYLEGVNANSNYDQYTARRDATTNDQTLGLDPNRFWATVERRLQSLLAQELNRYKLACGEYPWASPWASSAGQSLDLLQQGTFPTTTALPTNWGEGCASGVTLPSLLDQHWRNQLYYAFCLTVQGACININGESNVSAILIAPGVALSGQTRSSALLNDYFESSNQNGLSPFTQWPRVQFDGGFNDGILSIP